MLFLFGSAAGVTASSAFHLPIGQLIRQPLLPIKESPHMRAFSGFVS
jgi:hypothetical protein